MTPYAQVGQQTLYLGDAREVLAQLPEGSTQGTEGELPANAPDGLELWPHQRAAVDKLAPLASGFLFLDMGTGKSRAALALLQRWACKRVLILCPKSVIAVWPHEFTKAGLVDWNVLALGNGAVKDRERALNIALSDAHSSGKRLAVILNYEAASMPPLGDTKAPAKADLGTKRKLVSYTPGVLRMVAWDALVCDESHRIKDPSGVQSLFVGRLASKVPHRLGLTGTPMPHSPLDLYAQFRAVMPSVFGYQYRAFEKRYAVRGPERTTRDGGKYSEIVAYQHTDELQERMGTVSYRVMSDDVLELPEFVDTERYCLLEPKARRVYNDLECDLRAKIEAGEVTAKNALVKLLRLAQVANGFAKLDWSAEGTAELVQVGTEKADLLAELLADLVPEEPVVVFGRFHADLDTIHEVTRKAGRGSQELSGRRNELAAWQDVAGEGTVLAVQLQAGGLGVDLTRARYCVYFSVDFNLGSYLQTRKRIHRPGQSRSVTYVHLIAAGTVDEQVYAALAKREEVVSSVLDGIKHTANGGAV